MLFLSQAGLEIGILVEIEAGYVPHVCTARPRPDLCSISILDLLSGCLVTLRVLGIGANDETDLGLGLIWLCLGNLTLSFLLGKSLALASLFHTEILLVHCGALGEVGLVFVVLVYLHL